MHYTEIELRAKLRLCGEIMPTGEYDLIESAITSLVGKPRELRVFVESLNCEVVAHVIDCARSERVKREEVIRHWRENDRRKGGCLNE